MQSLDLSQRTDLPVPVEVLAELVRRAAKANVRIILVGAAARDLVVHAPREVVAQRATGGTFVLTSPNVSIHVAALPAQAALKVLAWRDRRHASTLKDAPDLAEILLASSEGPYGEATWEDDESLDATNADIVAAGAYRTGRLAAEPFSDHDAGSILAVLDDPPSRAALVRDMRTGLAPVLIEAFHAGFLATFTRRRSNFPP